MDKQKKLRQKLWCDTPKIVQDYIVELEMKFSKIF